jgi:hypothetical protein
VCTFASGRPGVTVGSRGLQSRHVGAREESLNLLGSSLPFPSTSGWLVLRFLVSSLESTQHPAAFPHGCGLGASLAPELPCLHWSMDRRGLSRLESPGGCSPQSPHFCDPSLVAEFPSPCVKSRGRDARARCAWGRGGRGRGDLPRRSPQKGPGNSSVWPRLWAFK